MLVTIDTIRFIDDRLKCLNTLDTLEEMTEELTYICELLHINPTCANDLLCEITFADFNPITRTLQTFGYTRDPVTEYLKAFIEQWENIEA